jgi:hypothetical protein
MIFLIYIQILYKGIFQNLHFRDTWSREAVASKVARLTALKISELGIPRVVGVWGVAG